MIQWRLSPGEHTGTATVNGTAYICKIDFMVRATCRVWEDGENLIAEKRMPNNIDMAHAWCQSVVDNLACVGGSL